MNYKRRNQEPVPPQEESKIMRYEMVVHPQVLDDDDDETEVSSFDTHDGGTGAVDGTSVLLPEKGATLAEKLFILQHTFDFTKDQTVTISGKTNRDYKFISLPHWWSIVEEYFKRNNLWVRWQCRVVGTQQLLVTLVTDVDSGESIQSEMLLPAGASFTDIGAAYEYWKRKELQSLVGVITSEDIKSERDAMERPSTAPASSYPPASQPPTTFSW